MGTTQSSPWLACHSDEKYQLEKEPNTGTDNTFTPSTTDTDTHSSGARKRSTRNYNNNDHPIRHKALHFICSCPCKTIYDQTNNSISSSTADESFILSTFKTPHNRLCFSSNASDQEDMNTSNDESPNNSLFYQRCIDSHQNDANAAAATTKSLQRQQHCPNIDGLNLDRVHPSRGPYLGTISWEPQSPMDCSKSLLDLSHHDPHEDDNEEEGEEETGGEEDCNGGMEEGLIPKTELVEPPISSPLKAFSPIPASSSSSSPLTYTVVQAKNDSDVAGTCSPTESGNEIEISFIPPKRLFQDSFVDSSSSSSNNNNNNHCNHHDSMDRSSNKDPCPTPSQSTIVLSTSNDNETMTPRQDDKFHDELAQDPLASSQCHDATTTSSITIQSSEPDGYPVDGAHKWGMIHINTLPSFQYGRPIRLKMKESYRGYETRVVMKEEGHMTKNNDNDKDDDDGGGDDSHDVVLDLSNLSLLSDATQQEHFFSYDPYFSLGQYVITTVDGGQYGNGLCVEMGERYMTLQDQNERVWGVIRSRHTWIPSAVIYSPKQRFCGQVASSHRPLENKRRSDGGNGDVKLYPWALVKKHGRRMDHNVTIHMVAEPNVTTTGSSSAELLGGLFEKKPMFRSRHGFDKMGNHQNTVVYRVAKNTDSSGMEKEYPCCKSVRDTVQKDLFHVTIAPGIDPLLIICYMASHSKMDVEPKLCGDL